uniref:VWFA domain-containing protein n=1 Tax=Bionectria ochroleuca TaxID=29856 RepID=A0A8H7NCV2_BIOOC
MGGTEILGAVKSLLGSRDTGMWTDIIVLTDGQVWRLDDLLATVKEARKASGNRIRFFCLGIGKKVSHALVEGIASMGVDMQKLSQRVSKTAGKASSCLWKLRRWKTTRLGK